jgi:hypothetical protein
MSSHASSPCRESKLSASRPRSRATSVKKSSLLLATCIFHSLSDIMKLFRHWSLMSCFVGIGWHLHIPKPQGQELYLNLDSSHWMAEYSHALLSLIRSQGRRSTQWSWQGCCHLLRTQNFYVVCNRKPHFYSLKPVDM